MIFQPISLGIFRSDYLIDTTGASHNHVEEEDADLCIKQVELNTISISAITSSSRTTNLHRYIYDRVKDLISNANRTHYFVRFDYVLILWSFMLGMK